MRKPLYEIARPIIDESHTYKVTNYIVRVQVFKFKDGIYCEKYAKLTVYSRLTKKIIWKTKYIAVKHAFENACMYLCDTCCWDYH